MIPHDAWLPVPLCARHVLVGDVFVGKGGDLWLVSETSPHFIARRTADQMFSAPKIDPDTVIQVLVPVTERDALRLTRDELGARLIERRT